MSTNFNDLREQGNSIMAIFAEQREREDQIRKSAAYWKKRALAAEAVIAGFDDRIEEEYAKIRDVKRQFIEIQKYYEKAIELIAGSTSSDTNEN